MGTLQTFIRLSWFLGFLVPFLLLWVKLYPAEWTPIFLGFPVKRTGFLG